VREGVLGYNSFPFNHKGKIIIMVTMIITTKKQQKREKGKGKEKKMHS